MTVVYQRFAALRPANTDEATLHPITTGELVGAVTICNQDSVSRTYRVAQTDAATGSAASGEDWLAYDTPIEPYITHTVKIYGMTGTATIRVKASVADKLSFVLSGMLVT